ncbi:MAG: MFS transporter [Clostridia bacterium]|nr:MFS transporter [Clostridia bacterium]
MYSLLLAIIYISFIGLGLPDSLLGSAWPVMHRDINAPVHLAGVISMTICLCTVLSSLMSNKLTSVFGAGKVTAVSTVITALALFGFSLATEFWILVLIAVPYGLGAGAVDSALNNYVALHYKSKHMSWLHCFWGLGASISPFVMGYALTGLNSWSAGYQIVCILQICISVVLFVSLPMWKNKTEDNETKVNSSLSLKQVVKIKGAKACFLAFFCYCGFENTTMLWASSYMVATKNTTPEIASSFASLFFIGITAGRALNGFLTIKLSDKTLIRIGEGFVLLGTLLIALPTDFLFTVVGFITIGLGCAPIYPCIIHMTPTLFGKDKSQAMIGVQMACAYTGSCLLPPLFGLIANATTFYAMPVFIAVFALALVILHETVVKKTENKNL